MITKHKIYFFFWVIFMFLKGYRRGSFVRTYSEEKDKVIRGVICGLLGDSITKDRFVFGISVHWFEPVQGNDARYYSSGCYDLEINKCFTLKGIQDKLELI